MAYQKPKATHPWKRPYKANLTKEAMAPVKNKSKPLRTFLFEVVESWEEVEVFTTAYGANQHYKLKELPQAKQAAWLAGILRRNYA